MPLVTTPNASPYPTIGAVMNLARVRVDDTALDLSGELLADYQPYTETLLNSAWRWLQTRCANSGIESQTREIEIYGVPASPNMGALNQAWITWLGCSDGVNQYETPVLPRDLILPLKIWRRTAGTQESFGPMNQADDGLPAVLSPGVYDWRDYDGMYFHPVSRAQDFRIRYSSARPDLILANTNDLVPMMFSQGALSARLAYEFTNLRGAAQAPAMAQLADDEFDMIAQRTGRKNQRRNLRRQPYARASQNNQW
jgi:hypothetical protein